MSSARRPRPPAGSRGPRGPRGPLPPGVYWRRRVFVLGIAFSLVFIIARVLTAGSDGSSTDAADARQAGQQVPATRTVTAGASGATDGATDGATGATGGATAPVGPTTPTLAAPQGECSPSDVAVTPSVAPGAVAGADVAVSLSLQTLSAEACTWQVDDRSLTVRIAQNGKVIWTTRQCPRMVPRQAVVVRRAVATVVEMQWNARESTSGCTAQANWVMPGKFSVEAAALGGEPAQSDFTLGQPTAKTIQTTPTPPATPTQQATQQSKKQPKKSKTPVN